ncbi:MAG: tetratricopeptide repeat protein [Candidatus Acidiferrum sp.]
MGQANREFQQGKFPEAMIFYGRVLQINPRSVDARYRLAQTHLKMGSWAAAYQELSKTVELDPQKWSAQLDLARLQLAAGKAQEARERSRLILHNNPKNVDAQILLSDADVAFGNLIEATEEAEAAIAMAPQQSDVYLNLGHIQARRQDLLGAEHNFKKAQAVDPQAVLPRLTLGTFYHKNKRWAEAENEFVAAIQIAPKDVAPRVALAVLCFDQGQESQGEKVLKDAKDQLNGDPNAYKLLGDSFLVRGQYSKALAEFAALATKYPDDIYVRKTYVQLLIQSNRMDEADSQEKELLKRSPQDPESLVLNGQIEIHRNQLDQAITTLQQAVKNAPDNALAHYYLGVAHKESGNPQQADGEWRAAVGLRPGLAEAWIALGTSATVRSDWHALQEISDQLQKNSPSSVDGLLFHATARYNQGDRAAAEADLNRLLQLAPDNPIPYIKLGQIRLSEKRYNDAEAYLRRALSGDPNSIDAVKGIVEIDLAKNRPAEALKFLQEQIDHNPNSAPLYLVQAQMQIETKQFADAESTLSRAADLDHRNVGAWVLLAQTQFSLGKTKSAISDYQKAIELSPRDPRLYVELGSVYEKDGEWQGARESYQKALAIQPQDPLASNNLAYLLLEHNGDVMVALGLAQTARKGLPRFPNAADTLGWAYYHNRAYSVAAPFFEDAVKAAPNNQTYRYHLGLTYQKLQDSTRARMELEKAIGIDPKSDVATRARQAMNQNPVS